MEARSGKKAVMVGQFGLTGLPRSAEKYGRGDVREGVSIMSPPFIPRGSLALRMRAPAKNTPPSPFPAIFVRLSLKLLPEGASR
jgi:hypothetical protein